MIILVATILSIWMAVRMGNVAHEGGKTIEKTEAVWYTILFSLIAVALVIAVIMLWYRKKEIRAFTRLRNKIKV